MQVGGDGVCSCGGLQAHGETDLSVFTSKGVGEGMQSPRLGVKESTNRYPSPKAFPITPANSRPQSRTVTPQTFCPPSVMHITVPGLKETRQKTEIRQGITGFLTPYPVPSRRGEASDTEPGDTREVGE